MAYDEALAERVRERLGDEPGLTERKMFGGLAFLLEGNMSVGLTGGDELMVRVGEDGTDDALAQPHTRLFDMSGRPMKGWIVVSAEGVAEDEDLTRWVGVGVAYARTLPPK
jgi:TfoX/Sxy family transcriptional regulator of competence genes